MTIEIPAVHLSHWMEPNSITVARGEKEKFCEFCGEEVPWHNNSCAMLKNAYRVRKGNCHFCGEEYLVGDEMADHTMSKHSDELKTMGAQVPSWRKGG